jgi:uncharacterized membrane protein
MIEDALPMTRGFSWWVEKAAQGIETLAVALIVAVIVGATVHYLRVVRDRRLAEVAAYEEYRRRLGRALLLGLEILVAADIVRTVALDNTLRSIVSLGILVLIRTFLSWSLMLEVEGRWPWQSRALGEPPPAVAAGFETHAGTPLARRRG